MLEITYFEKPLTMIDRDNHKANKDRVKYAHGDTVKWSQTFLPEESVEWYGAKVFVH